MLDDASAFVLVRNWVFFEKIVERECECAPIPALEGDICFQDGVMICSCLHISGFGTIDSQVKATEYQTLFGESTFSRLKNDHAVIKEKVENELITFS